MIRHNARHSSLLAGLLASIIALPTAAQTQKPQPSLGQSWPQMANVSAAPGWRVYVFEQDKVKYIQVNDLAGTVRVALAAANGGFLTLPLGADARRVSIPAQPLAAALKSAAPAVTVYQDNEMQLTVRYQNDGSVVWTAIAKRSAKTMTTQPAAQSTQNAVCPPCGYTNGSN